jgi:RNA polymerase sigma-70 factor (ECF subfamily)
MDSTSVSLLARLKSAPPDASDWGRLQKIYLPLIHRWIARVPGFGDEVDDLAQEVFFVVIRELPQFERRREGSFRAWLRQVVVNKVRTYRRRQGRRPVVGHDPAEAFLEQIADPASALALEWERDHDQHVLQKLLALVEHDFQATTWQAFLLFGIEGLPPTEVAERLGLSEGAVLKAKSRVLKRLREEAGELLE